MRARIRENLHFSLIVQRVNHWRAKKKPCGEGYHVSCVARFPGERQLPPNCLAQRVPA